MKTMFLAALTVAFLSGGADASKAPAAKRETKLKVKKMSSKEFDDFFGPHIGPVVGGLTKMPRVRRAAK